MSYPPNAPYDVTVGHEVEVRAYLVDGQEGTLRAECSVEGDTFGAETALSGSDLEQTLAIDQLVEGIAMLVWNELCGTPVFREEDEKWTERVETRAPWLQVERKPSLGYVTMPEVEQPEQPADEHSVAERFGDADVSQLQMSQDEMAALTRGEILSSLAEKVLRMRSSENLLDSALAAIEQEAQDTEALDLVAPLGRALQELRELRRRFGT